MQEKAKVIDVNGSIVSLVPQDIGACISCTNTSCKTNGHVFTAQNPHGFTVVPGMEVTVAAPVSRTVQQTCAGVVVPILIAGLSYYVTSSLFPQLSSAAAAGIAAAALFLSCGIFAILNRNADSSRLPEITGVLS